MDLELLLLVLTGLFDAELNQTMQETGLDNLSLGLNEDQSVSLMNENTTLAGFANVPALYATNGIQDILNKIPTWNLTNR